MPSGGPTIAKAYVAIIPTTRDAQKNITKELTPALGEAGQEGGEKLSGGIASSLKSGAAKLAGIAKAAIAGAGVAAIGKMVSDSVGAFSQFEQLTGGVQKIFDELDTSSIVADAQNAYKTLGMSANQYLESMTDVGATLAATLGDQKGYEVAKEGMQAISDYASGTGRDIDLLTDKYTLITRSAASYQSIADQFAGILPATSQDFLKQAQAAGLLSDEYTKLTDVPLPEYQEAVTKMMTKGVDSLGLLGNTAAESTSTLSGSTQMLKASWENLMTALGTGSQDDIKGALDGVSESIQAVVSNMAPVIGDILSGIVSMLPQIAMDIIAALPGIISQIVGALDGLLQSAGIDVSIGGIFQGALQSGVVQSILDLGGRVQDAFNKIFGDVDVAQTLGGIQSFISGILDLVGRVAEGIGSFIADILDSIDMATIEAMLTFIRDTLGNILDVVMTVGTTVSDIVVGTVLPILAEIGAFIAEHIIPGISEVIQAAAPVAIFIQSALAQIVGWIGDIAKAMASILLPWIQTLLAVIGPIFDALFDEIAAITAAVGAALKAIWDFIAPVIDSIVKAITGVYSSLADILGRVASTVSGVIGVVQQKIMWIVGIVVSAVSGAVSGIISTIGGIADGVKHAFEAAKAAVFWIWDSIRGRISEGVAAISSVVGGIADSISDAFESAFSGIKSIWNNTVGKISFRVPDWIPGIGGSDWSVPKLAAGGDIKRPGTVLVGEAGPELLSLPRGARVAPLDSATAADSGTTYQVVVGDVDLSDDDQVRRITREYLAYLAALARPALT